MNLLKAIIKAIKQFTTIEDPRYEYNKMVANRRKSINKFHAKMAGDMNGRKRDKFGYQTFGLETKDFFRASQRIASCGMDQKDFIKSSKMIASCGMDQKDFIKSSKMIASCGIHFKGLNSR